MTKSMTTMMTGISEDEYRFYHYQPDCTTIDCDTSDDEEDNAFQQITSDMRLPEVVLMKEPTEALESQSQMTTIMMTSGPMMIDGDVSSSYASSSSRNNNNKRDFSSALQLSASSSDLSAAMAGNAKNKNVRTSYVPHMRTRVM